MAKKKSAGKRGSRSRRGKSESMTGAKEGAVEVRTIGDNSGELALISPDDLSHHKKAIKGWKEKVATAQRGLQQAKATAKKAGVNLKSLDIVVSIERDNDPAAAMDFFRQVDLGLSLSEETTIRISPHDTLAGDQIELVYKRGYADGKGGRDAETKYPDGSDLANEYARGWRHGTAANLGVSPEESDAQQDELDKVAAE